MGVLAPVRPVSGLGSEPVSLTGWLAKTDTVDPMTHHQRQSRAFYPCAEQSPAVVVSTVHLRPTLCGLAANAVEQVRVRVGRDGDRAVAEDLRHQADVHACREPQRRRSVSQVVEPYFADPAAAALVPRAPRGSRETAGLPSGPRSSTVDVAEPSGSANMQVSDGSEGAPGGGRTHTERILRTQDRGHCGLYLRLCPRCVRPQPHQRATVDVISCHEPCHAGYPNCPR